VKELIAAGADVKARSGDGRTPLHVAAFFGRAEAVKELIAAGAGSRMPRARGIRSHRVRPAAGQAS